MNQTILVVDDKAGVRDMLEDYFRGQGFRVVTAADGQEALFAARYEKPDIVLLDIMMPQMDGYHFLPAFRRESRAPVILLTAKLDESDKVQGLELGADDYVTKPFGMRELLARVRAQLRRAGQPPVTASTLHVGDVLIDKQARTAQVKGHEVNLTLSEFDLLATMMATPGRVFSRDELLDVLGGIASVGRTVDVHIRNLRAKIEPDPANPRYIETVFGAGYRFVAETEQDEE
jgi:DNA-binding response OmpR family regulator